MALDASAGRRTAVDDPETARWWRSSTSIPRPATVSTSADRGRGGARRRRAAAGRLRAKRRQVPLPRCRHGDRLGAQVRRAGRASARCWCATLRMLHPTGGQERGYRRGTENLPAVLGMAAALEAGGEPWHRSGRAANRSTRSLRMCARSAANGCPTAVRSHALHRRHRHARLVGAGAADAVRHRGDRGISGQRLFVGHDEAQPCAHRDGRARRAGRRVPSASASAGRPPAPRSSGSAKSGSTMAHGRRRHDLPRLPGDHAARARGARGDAALARRAGERRVRQSAQPAPAGPDGARRRSSLRASRSRRCCRRAARVIFTGSATEALNLAMRGSGRRGHGRGLGDRACGGARYRAGARRGAPCLPVDARRAVSIRQCACPTAPGWSR